MASISGDFHQDVLGSETQQRLIPILSAPAKSLSPGPDPMDLTSSSGTTISLPAENITNGGYSTANLGGAKEVMQSAALAAAAGPSSPIQPPKVVQTAFVHKLYNMLEDPTIKHLISWSGSSDSFTITPSNEFAKVLSTYFKHTNVSSFVRQLNMYGFHKVSDVFQTGSPETPLWEFKHGNGNFRRGDLAGLREIKRRASRQALIHRDSFSTGPKIATSLPGPTFEAMPDSTDARLMNLEQSLYDMHARLAKAEDLNTFITAKCQLLSDSLAQCYQYNLDMSNLLRSSVTDPEHRIHRDVTSMQQDISRHIESLNNFDRNPQLAGRQPFYNGTRIDTNPPLSPCQTPLDDSRRGSLFARPNFFRPPAAHHPAGSAHSHYPISVTDTAHSYRSSISSQLAPTAAFQQQPPIPVTAASPPALSARRHTSADIHSQIWQADVPVLPNANSPFASGYSSGQWPSSPNRTPNPIAGDQQLRDTLARYQLSGNGNGPRTLPSVSHATSAYPPPLRSRNASPPLQPSHSESDIHALHAPGPSLANPGNHDYSWSLPTARFSMKDISKSIGLSGDLSGSPSGPPTRRSSMASNVHNLLNPAETAEEEEEEGLGMEELRKRKRLA